VPDTHVTARDGVHYRDGWLDNNHRAFLRMWQGRKDSAATSAHTVTPPRKKPRLGISTSRSAFLQSSIEQSTRQLEASLAEDEYEIWKRQPALAEEDWLSLNPLLYWESVAGQFPILSKFAIDVLTIPAAAADCERTFSELGDMLGTRRLHMKPELISALQSLKSWKRLGIQPTTTSASGLARTLSEEEISKIGATKQVAFQYRADRIHYNTFSPSVSTNILSSIDQTKFELEGLALVKLIHKLSKLDKTESG
ncbi:Dimer-Tnp-hAT domain containing protein, partial [Pyrenophora tritici-repentis]